MTVLAERQTLKNSQNLNVSKFHWRRNEKKRSSYKRFAMLCIIFKTVSISIIGSVDLELYQFSQGWCKSI